MQHTQNNTYPFVNLPLPYSYSAMEPFIDELTMTLHHDRHLQAYIDKLNAVLKDNPKLQGYSLSRLICCTDFLPCDIHTEILNNAGGVYNHRFFFDLLCNPSRGVPERNLAKAIDRDFCGFENFKERFKKAALGVFGSGYAWLVSDCGRLKIITTPNQTTPLCRNIKPVLCIDVWEHAYYLKHYNLRGDYVDDWFNVINWQKAERNYIF